jgi:hypothetical protein
MNPIYTPQKEAYKLGIPVRLISEKTIKLERVIVKTHKESPHLKSV